MKSSGIWACFLSGVSRPATLRAAVHWRLGLACALSFAVGMALRLMELPAWLALDAVAGGERIIATHDGYAFLAGMNQTSRYLHEPLVSLLSALRALTGLAPGTLGFWLPPLLASLAALPVCLVAARLGRSEAGLTLGVASAGCLGFFIRTRLGYMDTDVLTLFFALGTASGFVLWLAPLTRCSWRLRAGEADSPAPALVPCWAGAVLLGAFIQLSIHFYPGGATIVMATYVMASGLGCVLALPGKRPMVYGGLALSLLPVGFGLAGIGGGVLVVLAAYCRPRIVVDKRFATLGSGLVLLLLLGFTFSGAMQLAVGKSVQYLNPSTAQDVVEAAPRLDPLLLPGVLTSVLEAQRATFAQLGLMTAGTVFMLVLGLVGLLLGFVRRPLLLVFAPVSALGLGAMFLGVRFGMYGGVAMGIGCGFGLADFLAGHTERRWLRWGLQIALCALLILPALQMYRAYKPAPVLSPALAQTFREVGSVASPDATLWQWWDFGYAAQYYAGRETFGDGGRHEGAFLYPLALVHSARSPRQAAQVMRAVSVSIARQIHDQRQAGEHPSPGAALDFWGYDPLAWLREAGAAQATKTLQGQGPLAEPWSAELPEQYLVLGWENLRLAGWIGEFGSWNLQTGRGRPQRFHSVKGTFGVDMARGIVHGANSPPAGLAELYFVNEQGRIGRHRWPRAQGQYGVANKRTMEFWLMDRVLYESMMVQMLLGDPAQFEPWFELVVDKAPAARAYRLK